MNNLLNARKYFYLKFISGFCAVLLFGMCTSVWASNENFVKGETILYDITKFKVKVGEAALVYNGPVQMDGKQALSITFKATGFKFLDEEQILLDPDSFYPILIKRNLNIFGSEEKITEFYDAQKGEVKIVKIAKGKTTEQVIKDGKRFDNIYGFIYRLRKFGQFKKDETLQMHLPTRDVSFKLVKVKKFTVADQEYDTYYIRSKPRKYKVFFDIGPKKTPLRIDGAIGVGNMSMVFREGHNGKLISARK